MQVRIPKPSKKSFMAFVLLSLTLHLAVCKLPVNSSVTHKEQNDNIVQISLISVAAPSSSGNAKQVQEQQEESKKEVEKTVDKQLTAQTLNAIEPAAAKPSEKAATKFQMQTSVNSPTSNDVGNSTSTIRTLSENDYIQTVAPIYPKRAITREIQGTVIIRALISTDGETKNVKVASSSGYDMLDQSAMDAVSQWKFKKSAIADAKGEMWVQVPVKFLIQ